VGINFLLRGCEKGEFLGTRRKKRIFWGEDKRIRPQGRQTFLKPGKTFLESLSGGPKKNELGEELSEEIEKGQMKKRLVSEGGKCRCGKNRCRDFRSPEKKKVSKGFARIASLGPLTNKALVEKLLKEGGGFGSRSRGRNGRS